MSLVDNTTDLQKPVSEPQQEAINNAGHDLSLVGSQLRLVDADGNNIGVANLSDGVTNLGLTQNSDNIEITSDTGTDITVPLATTGLAGLQSRQDKTKLDTIEQNADVTDTANVDSAIAINRASGSTTKFLCERGLYLTPPSGGTGGGSGTVVVGNPGGITDDTPALTSLLVGDELYEVATAGLGVLVTSITSNISLASGAAETVHFTVNGAPSTVVNVAIVNTDPDGWVNTSQLTATTITLDEFGEGITSITLPTLSDGTRSFQLSAQVATGFQGAVLSPIVRQTVIVEIDSIVLGNITFGNANIVEDVTVTGTPNLPFTFAIENTNPIGWITSGALGATSGTLDANGSFTTTISIPNDTDDDFTRSFQIRVTGAGQFNAETAISPVITQSHTQTTPAGDLSADATFVYTHPNIDVNVNVTTGDPPFNIVLNENPTDSSESGLFSGTLNAIGSIEIPTFKPVSYDVSGAVDKSTLSTATNTSWGQQGSTMILRDDGDDTMGGANNDRIFLGASGNVTGGATLAFWNAGEDHSLFEPSLILVDDDDAFTSSNFGGDYIWRVENVPTDAITFLIGIGTGEHENGGTRNWTIPNDTWEIWEGVQEVPDMAGSVIPSATKNYYVHVTDADGDVVVDMETIDVVNEAPTGTIALTQGSLAPMGGDTVEFTATFTDIESDSFGYQWQMQPAADGSTFTDIAGETGATYGFTATTVTVNDIDSASDLSDLTDSSFDSKVVLILKTTGDFTDADAVYWAADESVPSSTDSVIAIFDTGADHRTATPLIVFRAGFRSSPSSVWNNLSSFYRDINDFDASSLSSVAVATTDPLDYTIPDANIEIWIGSYSSAAVPSVPAFDRPGLYRTVVTATEGNTTPVNSNDIELT